MTDFVEVFSDPETDAAEVLFTLSEADRGAARASLSAFCLADVPEQTQGRLLSAHLVLEILHVAPDADATLLKALIWPAGPSAEKNPSAVLEASGPWLDRLDGPLHQAFLLARLVHMKDVTGLVPPADAVEVWAEAIAIAVNVAQVASLISIQNQARLMQANLLADRAIAEAGDIDMADLDAAMEIYTGLLTAWPMEDQPKDHLLLMGNLAKCHQKRAALASNAEADQYLRQALDLFDRIAPLAKEYGFTEIAALARFSIAITLFSKAQREVGEARDLSLTRSIENFRDLCEIWGEDAHRGARVKAMVNRSLVLSHRARLRTAAKAMADFEAAAALCTEAIETFQMPGDEGDLARAWTQRAGAYWSMSRRKGGAAAREDLATALASYRETEKIWVRLGAERELADNLMDQAIVIGSMAEGEIGYAALRLLDQAVVLFTDAYDLKIKVGDTLGAAQVARNLATTLFERGERQTGREARESLTEAIAFYDKAASAYDAEVDAVKRASIKAEKASALLTRAKHQSRAEQARDLDAAIGLLEAYLAGLEMPHDAKDIGSSSFNCGIAYALRAQTPPTDRASLIDVKSADASRAAALYRRTLEIFAAPEDAVQAFEPSIALVDLLVWQASHEPEERNTLLAEAIAAAEFALTTYDVLAEPRRWLRAAEVWSRALFVNNDPRAQGALEEILAQGTRIVLSLPDTEGQETALRALSGVGDRLAVFNARRGELAEALAAVSAGRSIRATRDITLAKIEGPVADRRDAVLAARRNVADLDGLQDSDDPAREENTTAYSAALEDLRQAQEALEQALGQKQGASLTTSATNPNQLVQLLASGEALAVPVLSETGGGVIILAQNKTGSKLTFLDLPALTKDAVDRLLTTQDTGWLEAYARAFVDTHQQLWDPTSETCTGFMKALDILLEGLWEILMRPLDGALRIALADAKNGSVVLVLPGHLAGLPLAAARPFGAADAKPFLCNWTVTYNQSLAAWAAAAEMAKARAGAPLRLLAVSDPTEDLAVEQTYQQIDGAWRLIPKRGLDGRVKVLRGWESPGWTQFPREARRELAHGAATVPAVCAALGSASHAVFFCHGGWDRDRGTGSGLWLAPRRKAADNKPSASAVSGDILTMASLDREAADLSSLRLCVLAACETAPVGLALPDEFSGLAYDLSLRVPLVVSTLFPVTPSATALLLNAAMALHLGGPAYAMPRALAASQRAAALGGRAALRHIVEFGAEHPDPARLWMTETAPDAATKAVPVPIARAAEPTMRRGGGDDGITPAEDTAFDRHPFYWAAFVAIGAVKD